MKVRTFLVAFAAFGLGFVAHFMLSLIRVDRNAEDVAYHWKRFHDYERYMADPGNREEHNGLSGVTEPYSPEQSLMALVAAGELEYVDLVLPLVPKNRANVAFFMRFCDERGDRIPFYTGNPEYTAYSPSGDPPLHVQLWFKPSASTDIQQLIKELEEHAAAKTLPVQSATVDP